MIKKLETRDKSWAISTSEIKTKINLIKSASVSLPNVSTNAEAYYTVSHAFRCEDLSAFQCLFIGRRMWWIVPFFPTLDKSKTKFTAHTAVLLLMLQIQKAPHRSTLNTRWVAQACRTQQMRTRNGGGLPLFRSRTDHSHFLCMASLSPEMQSWAFVM